MRYASSIKRKINLYVSAIIKINNFGSLKDCRALIIFEKLVVRIKRVSVATQIQILNTKFIALIIPFKVMIIKKPFKLKLAKMLPGVINGNGKEIIAAKIGIKIHVLRKKNLKGIFEENENNIKTIKRGNKEIIEFEKIVVIIKKVKANNLILGSIFCRKASSIEIFSINIIS
jgi:hypothetical protein